MLQSNKFAAVILAAGEGKRMKSDLPKVMHLLNGKPLIGHVVEIVEHIPGIEKIVLVVSPKHTLVQDYIGSRAEYSIQTHPLGTGDAVLSTENLLKESVGHVLIVYGDMPLLSTDSLVRLKEEHMDKENVMTMMTVTVPNFEGEYAPVRTFGRIIRDENGNIIKNVEYKDATDLQKEIKELNPCLYCFQVDWMFDHLKRLEPKNAQGEYYLTDLIQMALEEKQKVSSIAIDPSESHGVSTQEDLQILSTLKK